MFTRQRQPLLAWLAVMLPVLLVVGIWLGGHPSDLPGFLRRALVADQDTRVVNQAIDEISHDYYRSLKRVDLANASIAGVVASLLDRFLRATHAWPVPRVRSRRQLLRRGDRRASGAPRAARRPRLRPVAGGARRRQAG